MAKKEKIDLLVELSDLISEKQEKRQKQDCTNTGEEIGFLKGLIYVKDIITEMLWKEIEK